MANIQTLLKKILSTRYGKDVRQTIHDAIKQCYEDGKAGSVDLTAREEIGVLGALTTGVKDNIVNALNWLNNILTTLSNNVVSLTQKVNKNETDIGKLYSDKQDKITGAATSIVNDKLEAKRVLQTSSGGNVQASNVTNTELSYLQGATSNIQGQINTTNTNLANNIITRTFTAKISADINGKSFTQYTVPSGYVPISVACTHLWFICGLAFDGYVFLHNTDNIAYKDESVTFRITFVKNGLVSAL